MCENGHNVDMSIVVLLIHDSEKNSYYYSRLVKYFLSRDLSRLALQIVKKKRRNIGFGMYILCNFRSSILIVRSRIYTNKTISIPMKVNYFLGSI